MDILSTAIGFLIGTITGASGTYFGNKYTDIRHTKEKEKAQKELWKILEKKYPAIITEMINDFSEHKHQNVRIFFIKSRKSIVSSNEPHFEYHTDIHENLSAAILYLQDLNRRHNPWKLSKI